MAFLLVFVGTLLLRDLRLSCTFVAASCVTKSGANPPQALGEAILQQRNPFRAERPAGLQQSRKQDDFQGPQMEKSELFLIEHLNSTVPVVPADTKGRLHNPQWNFL